MTRLRARTRGFTYPADADSLRRILEAGGLSKMAPEARATLRMKSVRPGEWCDDMPENAKQLYLERGDLEAVEVAPADAALAPRRRRKGEA